VGTRSSGETISAILKAFLDQRTWRQAELARHVGVAPPVIHKRLCELQAQGFPLHSERDHPHVYWSVPKSWFPGGVVFTGEQVTELLRQLSRMPKSRARDQLVATLLQCLPGSALNTNIVAGQTATREELYQPVIEDAASGSVSLRFGYFSASRGNETTRHASVHRVLIGPPARFVATCHRTGKLRWFRVANVTDARLDADEPFRPVASETVQAYLRESLDGFHSGAAAATHVFTVREPEARWVARNLMAEMQCEDVPGGVRVTATTAALDPLARYVVGLGGAARPLTAALEEAVAALARGALLALGRSSP